MQTCGKLLDFVVVLMALNGFLFPLTKFFFLRSIYNTKVIKLILIGLEATVVFLQAIHF